MRRRMSTYKPRIGRARTRIVRALFESENIYGYTLLPAATALTNAQLFQNTIPSWTSASGNQALTYAFTFNLGQNIGSASSPGNYKYVGQLYDYVKIYKVKVSLIPDVDPKQTLTTGTASIATQIDLRGLPQQDPVISWIDYDGFLPSVQVGGTSPVAVPLNGDYTQYVYNRAGARKHKPFRRINRTFVPKALQLIASDGIAPSGSPVLLQGKRLGWLPTYNAQPFTGQMLFSLPYIGPDAGKSGLQPQWSYTILTRWFMGFKTPLYG
jgi:hypothetical protein